MKREEEDNMFKDLIIWILMKLKMMNFLEEKNSI